MGSILNVCIDTIQDIDEIITLKARKLAYKVAIKYGISAEVQSCFLRILILLTITIVIFTRPWMYPPENASTAISIKLYSFQAINALMYLLGENLFSKLYYFFHRLVDQCGADSLDKTYGDGYTAWGRLTVFLVLALTSIIMLPSDRIYIGLLFALFHATIAFTYFATRQGNNKPRKRRKMRQKIVESIRERLANRQLAPNMS